MVFVTGLTLGNRAEAPRRLLMITALGLAACTTSTVKPTGVVTGGC
jgi:hypothetical protein